MPGVTALLVLVVAVASVVPPVLVVAVAALVPVVGVASPPHAARDMVRVTTTIATLSFLPNNRVIAFFLLCDTLISGIYVPKMNSSERYHLPYA